MTENIQHLIDHLRELDKKVAPAPWEFTGTKFTPPDCIEPGDLKDSAGYVLVPEIETVCPPIYVEMMVEARNAVPAMLAEFERLQDELKTLKEEN